MSSFFSHYRYGRQSILSVLSELNILLCLITLATNECSKSHHYIKISDTLHNLYYGDELNNYLTLVVVVAESRGRTPFLLFEDTIEVADVIEATIVAYLRHIGM